MAKPPTGMEEDKAPFERADAPQAAPPLEVLPIKGDIDVRAMAKDIMARFPRTMAKLAE
jgi:hypothetical protein